MQRIVNRGHVLNIIVGGARAAIALATISCAVPAIAKTEESALPMFERIAPPPAPGPEIAIYADKSSASKRTYEEVWDRMAGGNRVVRNVTKPTITPFLPLAGNATGAAVIVLPGGGFNMLSIDSEGWTIARWLADHGIAAFVLKYRVTQTPADETALMEGLATSMAALMTEPEKTMAPLAPPAVADAVEALKLVRADAAKWKIDPTRVGMLGFSAGAMATRNVVLSTAPPFRPNFFGYIYGPMQEVSVPSDAPPMFAALALDDPLFGTQGFGIVDAWHKAKRPVELHAYEAGGHGFGSGMSGTSSTMLLPEFQAWLAGRGLLGKP